MTRATFLPLALSAALLLAACSQNERQDTSRGNLSTTLKAALLNSLPSPGGTMGARTVITSHAVSPALAIISFCNAGKAAGAGDAIVSFGTEMVNKASWGLADILARRATRAALRAVTIDEGDAFCGVFVHAPGQLSRVGGVTDGSLYTSSYRDGALVVAETDRSACRSVSSRFLCFEVVEPAPDDRAEVDSVGGCFEAMQAGQLFSITFGRGESLPPAFAATLSSPRSSLSPETCVARGFAVTAPEL